MDGNVYKYRGHFSMGKVSNKNLLKICAVIGAFTLLNSQSSFADVPVPTLDRVKTEQSAFLDTDYSTYSLTEVTADMTAPEGSITVNIGGKKYFSTPTYYK